MQHFSRTVLANGIRVGISGAHEATLAGSAGGVKLRFCRMESRL